MRIVFVEFDGEVAANCVADNVAVGVANSIWQTDARRGEVVAEVSSQIYDGSLTAERKKFYEEIFELGRQYERQLQKRAKLQALDDATEKYKSVLEYFD